MKIKRLLCSLLSSAIIITSLGSSVSADSDDKSYGKGLILKGIINSNDDVNLSHIKVDIMSSELKQKEDDVYIYENTYQFSVYTDDKGGYSFSKPSPNCLVQIDLNSIPKYTGVYNQSFFVDNTNSLSNFTLCEIADVEIDGIDNVLVYDSLGNELITDVDFKIDKQRSDPLTKNNNSNYSLICTADANGYIKKETVEIVENNKDLIAKADALFNAGAISESEKIELYIEALESKNYEGHECLTIVYDALYNYLPLCKDKTIANKIISYIGLDENLRSIVPPEANYTDEGTRTVSNTMISYTLHYEKDSASDGYISESDMNNIQAYVQSIINHYFITYSFNTPMLMSGDTSYQMYFVPGLGSTNGFTRKYHYVSSGNPAGSLICINAEPLVNTPNDMKKTIAHEIFHSIQYAYTAQEGFTGNEEWFTEAGATYAGLNYVDTYLFYAESHANNYLSDVKTPFTDISNNRSYGMFLLPQYLSQAYGGLTSMKRTLVNVSNGYSVLKSMEKAAQYVISTATYGELFAMFQRYNADPRLYTHSNNLYDEATRLNDNVGSASNVTVKSTGAVHLGLKANSSTTSVTLTVNITSGSYSNAVFKIVRFPGNGGTSSYVSYQPTSSSLTIVVNSFKQGTTNSVYPRLTLVASNLSDDYVTSYKFGLTRTNN